MRSLHYRNGRAPSPFPTEPEQQNSGAATPNAALEYFADIIAELDQAPAKETYWTYLKRKVQTLEADHREQASAAHTAAVERRNNVAHALKSSVKNRVDRCDWSLSRCDVPASLRSDFIHIVGISIEWLVQEKIGSKPR